MELQINITKDTLRQSMNCGHNPVTLSCAIACAVREIWPNAIITSTMIHADGDLFSKHNIPLPDSATNFIRKFDRRSPEERAAMRPFSFTVEVTETMIPKWWEVEKTSTLELIT